MKHVLKIILPIIIIGIFNKETFGQIIPPECDQDSLENIFVSQCGYVGNTDYRSVHLFRRKSGEKHKLYLASHTGTITTIQIPPELTGDFWLYSSGPTHFTLETTRGEKWYFYFNNPKRGLTKKSKPRFVGHDNEGPIHE